MPTDLYVACREKGTAFETFVVAQLARFGYEVGLYETTHEQFTIGESRMGLEIKFDDQFAQTGNVYFEMAEKTRAQNRAFVPAGICRADNSLLYGIGNRAEFFVFGKRTLQRVHEAFDRGLVPALKDYAKRSTPTSQGFTLRRWLATAYAERLFRAGPSGDWFDAQAVSWSFRVDDLRAAIARPPQ